MTKRFMNSKGKILVPIILDDSAADVLTTAGQIARRTGLSLEVISVSEYWVGRTWPNEMMLGGPMADLTTAVESESMDVAASKLKKLVSQNLPDMQVKAEVLLGYAAECIKAHAVTIGAEIILIGGQGDTYRGVPKSFSTALTLMASAPCPVLVLPHGKSTAWDKSTLNAILADDLRPESGASVLKAYEWAAALGHTTLMHVHVNQLAKADLKVALNAAAAAGHESSGALNIETIWLAAMTSVETSMTNRAPGRKQLIEARGGTVVTKILQGNPGEELTKLVGNKQPDLVIFGRHRSWRHKPFAVGKLPFQSMLEMKCPILIADE